MLKHKRFAESWKGELRILHLNGDCGKNKCPEHGYPEEEVRRLNPDSNRQKLCCPVCHHEGRPLPQGWLFGEQAPEIRRIPLTWTREDLLSLHKIITWRLREVKGARIEYEICDDLPTWQWGYPKTECPGCEVKELVGCAGQEDTDQMEAEMKGSIFELERVTV